MEDLTSASDISIALYDEDKYTRDEFLGSNLLSKSVISRARESTEADFWSSLEQTSRYTTITTCYLQPVASGSMRTRVSWSSLSTVPSEQALLVLLLDSCLGLRPGRAVVSCSLGAVTKVSSFTSCPCHFS